MPAKISTKKVPKEARVKNTLGKSVSQNRREAGIRSKARQRNDKDWDTRIQWVTGLCDRKIEAERELAALAAEEADSAAAALAAVCSQQAAALAALQAELAAAKEVVAQEVLTASISAPSVAVEVCIANTGGQPVGHRRSLPLDADILQLLRLTKENRPQWTYAKFLSDDGVEVPVTDLLRNHSRLTIKGFMATSDPVGIDIDGDWTISKQSGRNIGDAHVSPSSCYYTLGNRSHKYRFKIQSGAFSCNDASPGQQSAELKEITWELQSGMRTVWTKR